MVGKARLTSFAILLLVVLSVTGCADPEPIKIGVVGQFSGRRSEVGVSVRNAIQLKVDQVNASGGVKGRPLELVIRDNAGDPAQCAEILRSMMDSGVQFILGPLFSQMAVTAVESVEGRDVLLVTPTMSTDYLSGRDDNIIRACSTTSKQGTQLADNAIESGFSNLAVVYDQSNSKYTKLLYDAFKERVEQKGASVGLVLTIGKTGHPEMLPLAREIVDAGPDGVLMCLSAVDAASLSQQIRKLGGDMQLYGVSWSQTPDLIQHGGRAVEGMRLVSSRRYSAPSQLMQRFVADYLARYKVKPSFAGGRGYDAISLLVEGMSAADSVTPTAVKQAVLALKDFNGVNDRFEFDEYGDALSGYFIVSVKGGAFVDGE